MKALMKKYLKYLVLAALLFTPVFSHLDTLPIRIFDEARNAVNAYEMFHDHNYIVTHFEGKPDMWNTKPPLLIWTQVAFMKVLGVNELSVRLPSALAALLTCALLLVFSLRYFKSFWFGFIAILVLITSQGYIHVHAARTGDYDAMLTLFTTLSGLFFFAFTETKKHKHLYLFFLFTALAVLTKSVEGLLFLPAILIYSIIRKQFIPLLKSKQFYIGLFFFLVLVAGYYLLRETQNPGYLAAVRENELGGRYLSVIENHKQGFWFYYKRLFHFGIPEWYLFVPLGLVTGFAIKDKKINRITLFSSLMAITFFLIISAAQTKLEWYDVPMYPFLAIIASVFIYFIFNLLQDFKWINERLAVNVTPFLFLFLITITPYQKIVNKTFSPKENSWDVKKYRISDYLQDAVRGKYNLNNEFVLYKGYRAQILFYLDVLHDEGVHTTFKNWKKLDPGNVVIASQDKIQEYVENHYDYKIINRYWNVITYKINGSKQ